MPNIFYTNQIIAPQILLYEQSLFRTQLPYVLCQWNLIQQMVEWGNRVKCQLCGDIKLIIIIVREWATNRLSYRL